MKLSFKHFLIIFTIVFKQFLYFKIILIAFYKFFRIYLWFYCLIEMGKKENNNTETTSAGTAAQEAAVQYTDEQMQQVFSSIGDLHCNINRFTVEWLAQFHRFHPVQRPAAIQQSVRHQTWPFPFGSQVQYLMNF